MTVAISYSRAMHGRFYDRAGFLTEPGAASKVIWFSDSEDVGQKDLEIHVRPTGFVRSVRSASFDLSLHVIGSPFVDLRTFSSNRPIYPPVFRYGPGTDRLLLPMHGFMDRGTRIDRDDHQVVSVFSQLAASSIPQIWVRPGFPSICRFHEWEVDGKTVTATLCSDITRPGGFVLLEPADIVEVLGYDPDGLSVSVEDLDGLVGLEPMRSIVEWADSIPLKAKNTTTRERHIKERA